MSHASSSSSLATVSSDFVEDWIAALRTCCSEEQLDAFLRRSGMGGRIADRPHRITLDQIVRLYQIAAVETGDEMMGLWSRPIRARALQHLLTTVREATSLPAALYRFSTFWNLLLDDFRFEISEHPPLVHLRLVEFEGIQAQRFGHMLILKLAHGLLSWLAGQEVPVATVRFAFERPSFAADYAVIFPAQIEFGAESSAISFDTSNLGAAIRRSTEDLKSFLDRAPRDWIFTSFRRHSTSLRLREFLYRSDWEDCHLSKAAQAMNITSRTLMRRLEAEATSFQAIKDALRRDLAIRDLQTGGKNIEEISQDLGFSSAANFHRAFRRWTGATPNSYRQT